MISRILLFGDTHGLPMLLRALPRETICGVVAAGIRPQYHDELRRLAEETGVPFAIQPLPAAQEYAGFVRWVRELSPQILWVNSYSMKLREEILRIPEAGALNIHGALLPYYRGCNPTQWAILRGESATGVTLHEVTAGIDEGPIIARKEVPLLFEDTWKDVQDRIAGATERLLEEIVPEVLSGVWRAEPQDEKTAWYGHRRRPEDGRFSWNDGILDIYNLIRALVAPHPGAFFEEPESGKTVIDRFTPLNEVLAMKLEHRAQRGFLCSNRLRLRLPEKNDESYSEQRRNMEWNGMESRAALRSVRGDDKDALYRWITNREFLLLNAPYLPEGEGAHEKRFESVLSGRNDAFFFMMEESESQTIIGSCRLFNINWIHRNAEIQIRIDKSAFQGKGYGSEAARLLVDFGFKDLHLHRIYLHVLSSNTRAINAYEKRGFVREGVLREAAYIDGGFVDMGMIVESDTMPLTTLQEARGKKS